MCIELIDGLSTADKLIYIGGHVTKFEFQQSLHTSILPQSSPTLSHALPSSAHWRGALHAAYLNCRLAVSAISKQRLLSQLSAYFDASQLTATCLLSEQDALFRRMHVN